MKNRDSPSAAITKQHRFATLMGLYWIMEVISRMTPANSTPHRIAACDFGSNSFHAAVALTDHTGLQSLMRTGERVQLAAGIRNGCLDSAAIQRGLDCVRRFAATIAAHRPEAIRAVATHAIRISRNAGEFLLPAEQILQCPIDVISGDEEARLIYCGVAHEYLDDTGPRLVIDIGGGSTELILGQGDEISFCNSFDVGCLTLKDRFFADGRLANFDIAVRHVRNLLSAAGTHYDSKNALRHVGTSGTLQAIADLLHLHSNQPRDEIGRTGLLALPQLISDSALRVDPSRRALFGAGVAIVTALFLQFDIQHLHMAHSDLRDGVLLGLAKKAHNAPESRNPTSRSRVSP